MSDQLPETIKPQSLVDTGGSISGVIALAKMKRLASLLVNSEGLVETQLEFARDVQGNRLVHGVITTELPLICQRCLETVRYPVNVELSLALIANADQMDRLPESYDPLVLDSPSLSLTELVEDELLLALPIVAMHTQAECNANLAEIDDSETESSDEEPHPFAALAQLKGKLDSTH